MMQKKIAILVILMKKKICYRRKFGTRTNLWFPEAPTMSTAETNKKYFQLMQPSTRRPIQSLRESTDFLHAMQCWEE